MGLTQKEVKNWQKVAREYLDKAGIALTSEEQAWDATQVSINSEWKTSNVILPG